MFWWIAIFFLVVTLALALPIIFEREVRESRLLSNTFSLKYYQHLFPSDAKENGDAFRSWLKHKDRGGEVTLGEVGKRVRTIRELTGAEPENHLDAIVLGGVLVQALAEGDWIVPTEEYAEKPVSTGRLLEIIIEEIDKREEPIGPSAKQQLDVRDWLSRNTVDLEQIVEILLVCVEILHYRAEASSPAG